MTLLTKDKSYTSFNVNFAHSHGVFLATQESLGIELYDTIELSCIARFDLAPQGLSIRSLGSIGIMSPPDAFAKVKSGLTKEVTLGLLGSTSPKESRMRYERVELHNCVVISVTLGKPRGSRKVAECLGQRTVKQVQHIDLHQSNVLGRCGSLVSWVSNFDNELLPWYKDYNVVVFPGG